MALPSLAGKANQVKTGPGILLGAAIGTTVPTLTVAAGKFTNSFPGWHYLGYTAEGATITLGRETAPIEVAEEFYEIKNVTTKVNGSLAVDLVNINRFNLSAVLNGGTWTISSSGDTQIANYVPAGPGEETRIMLAHIGEDSDEITLVYKAFQTAEISISRKKGEEKASFAGASFAFEKPEVAVAAEPWSYHYAGTWADDYTVIA